MKPSITVLGSAGSVGIELATLIKDSEFKDQIHFADSLSSLANNPWAEAVTQYLEKSDILVLCLPDKVAQAVVDVKQSLNIDCKILDASSAHRNNSNWVYGLPEIPGRTSHIADAELVSNPGCHASGAILSVKPLMDYGLAKPTSPLMVQSLTGYSGGGKAMIQKYQTDDLPTVLDYSLGKTHKHVPEIKAQTGVNQLSFNPSVVNRFRGMRTLCSIPINHDLKADELINAFKQYYQDAVQVTMLDQVPASLAWDQQAEKNSVQITVTVQDQMATVLAHYDNLRKGAASALLQNLRLMSQYPLS